MTWLYWTLGAAFAVVLAVCAWYTIHILRLAHRARRVQNEINKGGR